MGLCREFALVAQTGSQKTARRDYGGRKDKRGEKKGAHCSLIRGDAKLERFRNCAGKLL